MILDFKSNQRVRFRYTDGVHLVRLLSMEIGTRASQSDSQWMVEAFDLEANATRLFALADMAEMVII